MTYPNETPEWRKAWKLSDPDWVKARQKAWTAIKKSPAIKGGHFSKTDLSRIKTFFMTGSAFDPEPLEEEWRFLSYHPDKKPLPVSYRVLVECWLNADQSEARWLEIKKIANERSYDSSRRFLREITRIHFPEQGTMFNGLDERLYYFFTPTRCRPEDYPDLSVEKYRRQSRIVYADFFHIIEAYLKPNYNPASIAPVLLLEWCDSVVPSYEALDREDWKVDHIVRLKELIQNTLSILNDAEGHAAQQVAFAQNFVDNFRGMTMPASMEKVLKPFLGG